MRRVSRESRITQHHVKLRASCLPTMALLAVVCAGCEDEPINGKLGGPDVPNGQAGSTLEIAGSGVQVGFALGHMRRSVELESFRISKHPVTIGEYRACVSAGRCAKPSEATCAELPGMPEPNGPNFHREGLADDAAVTCPGLEGARQYCAWVGGKLPTLEQWLLSARGPSPQRHPWGETPATCEQHPHGVPPERLLSSRCPEVESKAGRVGLHAAGASALGLQDVLLTRGELLASTADALFPACSAESSAENDRACIVWGMEPGAIDSVQAVPPAAERGDTALTPYGFRCVWGGGS
jgi:formylglycine-generating enzyme required for sulfatase activity